MPSGRFRGPIRLVVATLVLGLYAPLFCQVSAGADAPTPTVDPLTIDRIWQKASAAYDGQRAQILKRVDHQASDGPFRPEWQSLATYQVPDWYKDAKFGIFIHCGLYAVPAFGSEQYPRAMYTEGSKIYKHHLELRAAQQVRLQRLHSHVPSRALRSGGMGAPVQTGR